MKTKLLFILLLGILCCENVEAQNFKSCGTPHVLANAANPNSVGGCQDL